MNLTELLCIKLRYDLGFIVVDPYLTQYVLLSRNTALTAM